MNSDNLLHGIRAFDEAITAEPFPSSDAQEIGDAALGALHAGHLCLLQFQSNRFCRWATVIGVERDRTSGDARTLLLLDSEVSEPFGLARTTCVSNCRRLRGDRLNASAGFTFNCRDLMGGASAVRLRSLIVLRHSTQAGL